MNQPKRKLLTVVMDGIGDIDSNFGNAVNLAWTPYLDWFKQNSLYRKLYAHGTYVGLPTDSDIGNSEVGHNAFGAGRIFDQGAKLVNVALESGGLFEGEAWQKATARVRENGSTLHFLGLLSDGNVHSHEKHLYTMMEQAVKDGVKKIAVHALLDGRDVGEKSAETYIERLEAKIHELSSADVHICVGSAGGRMTITMDRYEADWAMVEKGWKVHVLGEGEMYPRLSKAISHYRQDPKLTDQYLPGFVIGHDGKANAPIVDGDSVLFFNFRGDRAIEISRAFQEKEFSYFDRGRFPEVFYAGMMEYDGDAHIPSNYLVSPPQFQGTLGERLASKGVRQFACSETQKFGHVTYFWNGNKSGYFDEKLEHYLEIPSDNIPFDLKPWMKAYEICEATEKQMLAGSFDYGRINFANGDMVGHTGNLDASITAVQVVDQMLGSLIETAKKTDTILMISADHGNCDEMFQAKEKDFPDWQKKTVFDRPTPKTAHTLSPVPFYLYDPKGQSFELVETTDAGLGNVANTCLEVMGMKQEDDFLPSVVKVKS